MKKAKAKRVKVKAWFVVSEEGTVLGWSMSTSRKAAVAKAEHGFAPCKWPSIRRMGYTIEQFDFIPVKARRK